MCVRRRGWGHDGLHHLHGGSHRRQVAGEGRQQGEQPRLRRPCPTCASCPLLGGSRDLQEVESVEERWQEGEP